MNPVLILIIVLGIAALWAVSIYNTLVRLKQQVAEAFSGIDVQLKRRSDLIPNLVETVKGYMAHEKGVLDHVTELRTQAMKIDPPDVEGRAAVESQLSAALGKISMVAENYPDLKANQNYLELMRTLTSIESEIQMARRYYNGSVRDFNTNIQSFPGNLVAGKFGFQTAAYFELDNPSERSVPSAKIS